MSDATTTPRTILDELAEALAELRERADRRAHLEARIQSLAADLGGARAGAAAADRAAEARAAGTPAGETRAARAPAAREPEPKPAARPAGVDRRASLLVIDGDTSELLTAVQVRQRFGLAETTRMTAYVNGSRKLQGHVLRKATAREIEAAAGGKEGE